MIFHGLIKKHGPPTVTQRKPTKNNGFFEGKSTENHGFSHEMSCKISLIQPIQRKISGMMEIVRGIIPIACLVSFFSG